ncbi:MAG: hypothetical protein HY904_08630 [Deltaproteobacteria bacterium]|nr:hypothetical protein [Deltaproteobacteria bacterium]
MLSINGSYTDNWNTAHTIAQDTWVMTFSGASPTTFTIHEYHNDADFLVAQNDPADPYNPSMWSRIDWTYDATGALWYCQIVFNAADQATAAANTSAVRTDPGASGCGSFAWNRLANPADLEIIGSYVDNWASTHAIAQNAWVMTFSGASPTTFTITQVHNNAEYLVAQNDPTDPYNPSKWSRFDWTYDAAGALWYCQIIFDAADEATAAGTTTAVRTDPGMSGCGSFGWNNLTP